MACWARRDRVGRRDNGDLQQEPTHDRRDEPNTGAARPTSPAGPTGRRVPPGDGPPRARPATRDAQRQAREWLAQLQQMIDRVAAEAGPVARDVAAKAAELAAVAGEKAGPIARRAAEVTGDVGTRVAERSRRFADDLRHRAAEGGAEPSAPADAAPADPAAAEVPPLGAGEEGWPSRTDLTADRARRGRSRILAP